MLIEDAVKQQLPAASNVVVVGEARKYLVALITLKSDWRGQESEVALPTTGLHPLSALCTCASALCSWVRVQRFVLSPCASGCSLVCVACEPGSMWSPWSRAP